MIALRVVSLLLAVAPAALAHPRPRGVSFTTPGPLVSLSVEVEGRPAPLYPAPDGSGRFYLEAHEGRRYSLTLNSRCAERLGVVLTVDGLNVISGKRDSGRGRMYVLAPWQQTTVRGWRRSLQDVHEFTFVDERRSYAARSGKANRKMGWIELSVYREREIIALRPPRPPAASRPLESRERDAGDEPAPEQEKRSARADEAAEAGASYPGTGWGRRTHDPVVLVDFRPESRASQTVTLRYEYRPALVTLGVLSDRGARDRLREREHAESAFAQPPRW